MTDTCPSWPMVLAWLEKDLPGQKANALHEHVPARKECQEKLALMDAADESLRA